MVSIPRLSAPSYHLLGKINAMQTLNSTRRLCLLSKWLTIWTQLLQRVSMIIYNTKRLLIWQWLCGTVGKSVVLYNERTQLLRDKGKRLFVGYLRLAGEGSMSIGDPITITRVKWGVKNPSPLPKLKILVGCISKLVPMGPQTYCQRLLIFCQSIRVHNLWVGHV